MSTPAFSHKLILLAAALSLSACATGSARVPVSGTTIDSASPSTRQTVQLLDELTTMRQELMQLRNLVEQQQFELENLSQRQSDLYQSLDNRLRAAAGNPSAGMTDTGLPLPPAYNGETNAPSSVSMNDVSAVDSASTSASTSASNQQVTTATVGQAGQTSTAAAASAASGDAQAGFVTGEQQMMYDKGFDLLKQAHYAEAIQAFEALINQHPQSALADDALYWVGEANQVNRNSEAAITAFRRVISSYPSSDRVPEALLKIGYIQYDIGDYDAAKNTLTEVVNRYPTHPVTVSANSRLQRINRQ